MTCSSFALSSSCPDAPITAEIATAIMERLRQVEFLWKDYLTGDSDNAKAWGQAENVGFVYNTTVGDLQAHADACVVQIVPNFGAFPGVPAMDEAFHTLDAQGRQVCYISYVACGAEWPSAASHEVNEARINPMLEAQSPPSLDGTTWDLEVCDPVQGSDTTPSGTGVLCANAVGPAYFGMSTGPLDVTGAVTTPFQELPGGYHNGSAGQIFGEHVPEKKKEYILRSGVRGKKQRGY